MTVQFGMRPQIMGWPFRVGGDIPQVGSARGVLAALAVAFVACLHPLAAAHLLWQARPVTGAVLLYLLTHALCVQLCVRLGSARCA